VALKQAGEKAQGAAMYVTLEPCCHFKKRTPPCTQAIISAQISQVHMATLDPNALVAGRGRAELEAAGIETYVGEHGQEAQELNESYIKFITTGMPFVIAKFAMSLDGKLATRSGDSKWISNEQSRHYVHKLRQRVDAIMVGVNTVLTDDPQLTARVRGKVKAPLRVIADSKGQTPSRAQVLHMPGKTLIAATKAFAENKAKQFTEQGAEVLTLPSRDGLVDLMELMRILGQREIASILVEGGGTLLGSLFDLGLVDRVIVFIAPIIIGGREALTPVEGKGVDKITSALRLSQVKIKRFDEDVMINGLVRRNCYDG
jgi:diaminohydroxyphosphoribosylaminopyrimidine deaminase/5-amino-6-(5-phosphoribosylamino)uracil reductase